MIDTAHAPSFFATLKSASAAALIQLPKPLLPAEPDSFLTFSLTFCAKPASFTYTRSKVLRNQPYNLP